MTRKRPAQSKKGKSKKNKSSKDKPSKGKSAQKNPLKGKASKSSSSKTKSGHSNQRRSRAPLGLPVEGIIKRHPDGFGFFIPDNSELPDAYIPRHEMQGVMSSDRVLVQLKPESRGDRFRGEVIEVIARGHKRVTGRWYDFGDGRGVIRDSSLAWGQELRVNNPRQLDIEDGQWASVEVTSYPDEPKGFCGDLLIVLGETLGAETDIHRVINNASIPDEFSKAVEKEVKSIPTEVSDSDISGRRDLRNKKFLTIDGVTAKDFDDAIYVEKTPGGFKLFVAIADVSHYVKPNSAIDDEAIERGTSTYFPNYVVPMLPEALSNEMCSLKPNVDRLALVAEIDMDHEGEKTGATFYEAVIRSHRRETYGGAQELIDLGKASDDIDRVVLLAADLANILLNRRFKAGSLDLEIPETEVEVDEKGEPVDILRADRVFAHRLIEEMMLAANVAVAECFVENEIPCLFRIHETPERENIDVLQNFLTNFGSKKSLSAGGLQKKISAALQAFENESQRHVLNILTLRSMKQAQYDSNNIGHFGLGFENYTHFTSPIRRYPDLIVHRTLKAHLKIKGYALMSEEDLQTAGTMLSAREQRSVKAERQLISIKKARFIRRFLGEEFDGVISSVTKFGVFVVLRQYDVDGLIKLDELGHEKFTFDEENLMLFSEKTGRKYELGQTIKIVVSNADIEVGQVDFVLADSPKKKDSEMLRRGKVKSNDSEAPAEEAPDELPAFNKPGFAAGLRKKLRFGTRFSKMNKKKSSKKESSSGKKSKSGGKGKKKSSAGSSKKARKKRNK